MLWEGWAGGTLGGRGSSGQVVEAPGEDSDAQEN